ncbi:pectate lyase family protein [Pararcticibacter amylolyticus]|nr:pectate lyase [Pararcticibacter amylolyticus]
MEINLLGTLRLVTTMLLLGGASYPVCAQSPAAFPGAEGFGRHASGGRGGRVIYVSNLNDAGEGSLRKAIQAKGPRTIIFSVSGTIALEGPLDINNGDVTIAGQSAPGDGICIKNYPVSIKADNVIIRYMRFRMGDEKKVEADALGANKGNNNIIIDHCSMSWATDECASFYHNRNFTMQWCIIAESLNSSVHAKGEHGYGGIWGGEGASFHHNLIASHKSRTPRFSGSSTTPNSKDELVDFRNNVIYNWEINSVYGGERGRYNVVSNYFKAGPATLASKKQQILNPWSPYGQFYLCGNVLEGNKKVSKDNWTGVKADHPDSAKTEQAFTTEAVGCQDAAKAYASVLKLAGASFRRDKADVRLTEEVRTGSSAAGKLKNGIIDSPKDVEGWPELRSLPAPLDSDKDGIADEWEKKNNLNPSDPADAAGYTLSKEYTNIEVYLNSLVLK